MIEEVPRRPQPTPKPANGCLTRTARGGAPTAAPVSAGWQHRLPIQLGETTIELGPQQRLFVAVLKRYVNRVVTYETLWHWLYDQRRFRRHQSLAALQVLAQGARRRLPSDWRVVSVPYYGYYLEKVAE